MTSLILASERIFHTIQGEGKFMGYPCTFVRLSMCNLRCEWKNADGTHTQCDTPYTSFEPEKNEVEIAQIVDELCISGTEHIIISGGEPFFQKNLGLLTKELRLKGKFITIETNGTIYHENQAQFLSISPKLKSSSASSEHGRRHDKNRINLGSLSKMIINHNYQFKFVVNSQDDIDEIHEIANLLRDLTEIDINEHIWLMPQGTTREQFDEKAKWIWEVCKENHWKYTDRLHVRVYGHQRGV